MPLPRFTGGGNFSFRGRSNLSVATTREDFDSRKFFAGIARGIAGALLFALPMFMTMEMWELGFYMDRSRLFLLLIVNIPLLVILSDRIGFERTSTWRQAIRDASIAYGLGVLGSALILIAMGVLKYDQSPHEIIGIIAIQAIPASIGAMLGRSQLGGQSDDGDDAKQGDSDDPVHERETSYAGELFLMAVGALFLNLNVAPTEEMILLSYKMTPWHGLLMIAASLAVMHGFVYALSFKGSHDLAEGMPSWHAFVRFTLPGYVIAGLISAYCLWTFHRTDDIGSTQILMAVVVLSFPGAIGAAAARLIL
ncbi:TIGR02587 family membrane protein [Rhizobium johnstonii]|uniref:TIGR02587 family membrane protein n=1 Tax=Rhizobium leguminosarum bv. viciae TaxID=387 RepID=A0A8G2IVZ0_RHILV|nr:TIGR02587 family membrane protein [Rhizobium leguminosarum]MCA2433088.1 TIGR02587 family membrane protein [Rhizobium leguminosarum]NEH45230.1 TIGR02587 family membrane protein [Rhizobium leguminosarum]NKK09210.1 TIGR02587 family membrane protein [Rhizobium leguminosarum bv. viciae]NKK22324.1 TIGR02587 family membrane protein [Rhizobium leguminosarum bv. viciae]NKK51029.1 TIGR02587 family membrane protein [Rhizobium leguminosarum bv. viciae]